MHSIQFGYSVPIFAYPGGRLFRTPSYAELSPALTMHLARLADDLGYHALWVADHLMLGRDHAILEGWTTLAALAGSTRQARLGLIHQAHFFRHPALAAKMAATLDQISGGRFIYFSDQAFSQAEHAAYGLPWPPSIEERIDCVREGVELALALWQATAPVTFVGETYQVHDAVCTPRPVQQPHPPIWFGEAHPMTLDLCARYGQGWNTVPVAMPELRRRLAALAAACAAIGRDHHEIEKSLETQILIGEDRADLRRQLRAMLALTPESPAAPAVRAFVEGEMDSLPDDLAGAWLVGTPDEVERRIRAYVELGVTHFMLWFMDAPHETGMRLFAHEVAPRFRWKSV